MPNLQQMNPGTPSISQELAHNLGGGIGGGLSQTLQTHLQGKQNKRALSGLAPSLKQSGMSDEDINSFVNSGLDPKIGAQVVTAHLKNKGQDQGSKEGMQASLDRMLELSKSKNIGIRTNPKQFFSDKAVGEQAEFESSKAGLIAALRDKVNKGVLSNQKFDYIVNHLLPTHNERQAAIRGKLKSIARETGLKFPGLEEGGEKESSQESGTVLMKDPSGALRQVPRQQAMEAQQNGYKLEQK